LPQVKTDKVIKKGNDVYHSLIAYLYKLNETLTRFLIISGLPLCGGYH